MSALPPKATKSPRRNIGRLTTSSVTPAGKTQNQARLKLKSR
jgi:hypothetical protein